MAAESALQFLRSADGAHWLPPAIVIAGQQAFLREYVLETIARRLAAEGLQYRSFQIGAGDDYAAVLDELGSPDLFTPKRLIVCRVLRSRRASADESASGDDASGSSSRAGETALAEALEQARGPSYLVAVFERDAASARVRRAADKGALLVNCGRPFDDQLEYYAHAFARAVGLRLAPAAADFLIARHGADLAAIANAIAIAAIVCDPKRPVQPDDLGEEGARRMPEAFEIAESLGRGRAGAALTTLGRAIALGRDPFEILAVEIIPAMRRMMLAATMLAARKSAGDIAAALGLPPQSSLAARAIDGARRFGFKRLERAYRRAAELDTGFKNGTVREREHALAELLIELMGPDRSAAVSA
jgi:DNA polymerase III delta subunit